MAEKAPIQPALRVAQRKALLAVCIFTALVTAKFALVRWLVVGGGRPIGTALDVLFIFGVFALVDLFFSDMRFRALLITDAVFSGMLLAITVYHGYYELLPTRDALAGLGQAATVTNSIATLLNPLQLLLFVDIPLLLWWGVRAKRRNVDVVTGCAAGRPIAPGMRTPYVYQRRSVYVAGVIALVVFGLAVNEVRLSGSQLDGYAISRRQGLTTYLVADVLGSTGLQAAASANATELQLRIDELKGGSTARTLEGFTTGQATGSNIIIIQVEALQAAAIGAKMGGAEVTPNLNRLIERSWYFPNHMSGIGRGTTADAEFLTNTSLYPPYAGAASLMYADRELSSLPRLLRTQGYTAETFHTNSVQYWNRSQLYPAIGFDRYFDDTFFGSQDKIAFGASDRVLFGRTLDILKQRHATDTPFYAQVVTMSSHYPFTEVPVNERTLKPAGPYVGTIEGDYLTEINYTDRAIGEFVDELETSGVLEDSILVIYGDHFGLPDPQTAEERAALTELLGHEYTPVDRLNTPLIVRLPGQTSGRKVPTPVGQVDLAPSLADALGVDLSGMPHFGRSIFSLSPVLFEAGGLLPLGSYVDGTTLYVAGDTFATGSAWSIAERRAVQPPVAGEAKYQAIKELLELSDSHVRQLPARTDFDPNAKVILPTQ